MKRVALAFLAALFLLLVRPVSAGAVVLEGKDKPPASIYAMGDWRNCDYWSNYGVGSQYAEFWSYFSIQNNLADANSLNEDYSSHYDWSKIDHYLEKAQDQKDSQGRPKPVILTIQLFGQGGSNFYIRSPNWLSGKTVTVSLSGCPSVQVPNYLDGSYQTALRNTIYQMGRRYNSDSRVSAIFIASGIDDESRSVVRIGNCDYYRAIQDQIPDRRYNEFVNRVIDWYADAFPNKTLFIQPAAAVFGNRAQIIDHAVSRGVGIKMNGLTAGDTCGAYGWGGPEANKYHFVGFADYWHEKVPVAFEPKMTINNKEVAYWIIIQGLAHKIDLIDIQSCPYLDCGKANPTQKIACDHPYSFSNTGAARQVGITHWISQVSYLPEMIKASLGVHRPEEAEMIWIVLRDHDYPNNQCPAEGERGDWDFYLYRPENITDFSQEADNGANQYQFDFPKSKTKLIKAIGSGLFSRQNRRTDEASGNTYMSFLADENWGPKKSQHAGYKIIITLKDSPGIFSLDYYDQQGLKRETRTKSGSNEFRDFEFQVPAVFDNQFFSDLVPQGKKGADFLVYSGGDGDEIIHRILVEPLDYVGPSDKPTPVSTGATPPNDATFWDVWKKEFVGLLLSLGADKDSDGKVTLLDFNLWRRETFK